jgi:hypothetical protein
VLAEASILEEVDMPAEVKRQHHVTLNIMPAEVRYQHHASRGRTQHILYINIHRSVADLQHLLIKQHNCSIMSDFNTLLTVFCLPLPAPYRYAAR